MTPHARTASIFASTTSISLMNITIPFPVVTAFIPGSSTADRIPSPVSTSHRKKNAHPSSRIRNKLPLIVPATVGRGGMPPPGTYATERFRFFAERFLNTSIVNAQSLHLPGGGMPPPYIAILPFPTQIKKSAGSLLLPADRYLLRKSARTIQRSPPPQYQSQGTDSRSIRRLCEGVEVCAPSRGRSRRPSEAAHHP